MTGSPGQEMSRKATRRHPAAASAIGAAVTLAALVVAELAVRVAGIEPLPWPSADRAVYAGLKIDPVLGPVPRPGWSGLWFGSFPIRIDSGGFRATGFEPPTPPATRVAFLGDSCSFGWRMDTRETYVARIDAMQRRSGPPRFELLNGAYPGDSAVVGLYRLREAILDRSARRRSAKSRWGSLQGWRAMTNPAGNDLRC